MPLCDVCREAFSKTQQEQTTCNECPGETKIIINADETVRAVWTGASYRGSLFQIMAGGNVALANRLDAEHLAAVLVATKLRPFPIGSGKSVFCEALARVREKGGAANRPLGRLRQAVVHLAGDGCNAPIDSYLKIAVKLREAAERAAPAASTQGELKLS